MTAGRNATEGALAGRQPPKEFPQAGPQAPVAVKEQRRSVRGEQMQARDLVTGHLGERVERDAQHLVDVEARADRLADDVQDAEVRLDVQPPDAFRPPDEIIQLRPLPVGEIEEMERASIEVGSHDDRRDVQARLAVGQRQRQRRLLPRSSHAARANLDPRGAEIDRCRLKFTPVRLAGSDRQRDGRAGGAPPLDRRRVGTSRGTRFETSEHLGQALEGDRLADEVERARP